MYQGVCLDELEETELRPGEEYSLPAEVADDLIERGFCTEVKSSRVRGGATPPVPEKEAAEGGDGG